MNVVSSNPRAHSFSSCYGVVNLKLLCDPPLRVSSRWVGGSESGWVGQPKSREGELNPPPPSITKQRPVSYREDIVTTSHTPGGCLRVIGATKNIVFTKMAENCKKEKTEKCLS